MSSRKLSAAAGPFGTAHLPMSHGRRVLRAQRAQVARLRDAAVENAARGWPVFPLAPGRKLPIFHHKDRCHGYGTCRDGHLGWQERATRDEDQIRRWWTGTKAWNIGIACGPSGLLVIDLDVDDPDAADNDRAAVAGAAERPRNGAAELARVAAEHTATLPATFSVETPTGGRHHYYRAPCDLDLTLSQGRLGPGIDTRGRGGLVVAAGSVRSDGHYRITDPREAVDLPRWLATLLLPQPSRPVSVASHALTGPRASAYLSTVIELKTAEVRGAAIGTRQWTLKVAARRLGQFVGGDELDERQAYELLYAAARGHIGVEAMDHREVDAAIRGGLAYGKQAPIRLTDTTPG